MEDLFFSNGEISISQKSLPECMHLAGIIAALSDENGTLIKGLMQGLFPDIDSQGRTIYSFRFPAEVKHDAKIPGLNTQRIFLKRDNVHGLREEGGSLIATEIDYEPTGDRDDTECYIRTHKCKPTLGSTFDHSLTIVKSKCIDVISGLKIWTCKPLEHQYTLEMNIIMWKSETQKLLRETE
jgi:hypothetical protein